MTTGSGPLGQALRAIVEYRCARLAEAQETFEAVAERAAALRRTEPRDVRLLDTHGIVLTGLAVTDPERQEAHVGAAVAAFRQARARTPGGHGAVLRVLQLLHQLAVGADPEVIDRARAAASGTVSSPSGPARRRRG